MKFKYFLIIFISNVLILKLYAKDFSKFSAKDLGLTTIEYAKTPQEQATGLMHRSNLCENCAMLFVYDKPVQNSFWMKETIISLDMLFINEEGKIVAISEDTEPLNETILYKSPVKYNYVLETNAGFAKKKHVKIDSYFDMTSFLKAN